MNVDPANDNVPYPVAVDCRDLVDLTEVLAPPPRRLAPASTASSRGLVVAVYSGGYSYVHDEPRDVIVYVMAADIDALPGVFVVVLLSTANSLTYLWCCSGHGDPQARAKRRGTVPSPSNKYRDRVCKNLEMTGIYHTILKFPELDPDIYLTEQVPQQLPDRDASGFQCLVRKWWEYVLRP